MSSKYKIAIKKEPGKLGPPYEQCSLCEIPTPYWSVEKDVPVCATCAAKVTIDQVPSKEEWVDRFIEAKEYLRTNWRT